MGLDINASATAASSSGFTDATGAPFVAKTAEAPKVLSTSALQSITHAKVLNEQLPKGSLTERVNDKWRGIDAIASCLKDGYAPPLGKEIIVALRTRLNDVVAEFNSQLKRQYGTKFLPIQTLGKGDVAAVPLAQLIKQLDKYIDEGSSEATPQTNLRNAAKQIFDADQILDQADRGYFSNNVLNIGEVIYDEQGRFSGEVCGETVEMGLTRALGRAKSAIDNARNGTSYYDPHQASQGND